MQSAVEDPEIGYSEPRTLPDFLCVQFRYLLPVSTQGGERENNYDRGWQNGNR